MKVSNMEQRCKIVSRAEVTGLLGHGLREQAEAARISLYTVVPLYCGAFVEVGPGQVGRLECRALLGEEANTSS